MVRCRYAERRPPVHGVQALLERRRRRPHVPRTKCDVEVVQVVRQRHVEPNGDSVQQTADEEDGAQRAVGDGFTDGEATIHRQSEPRQARRTEDTCV